MRGLRVASLSIAGASLGALLWACGPGLIPTGELGNGQFSYTCSAGSVDTACTGGQAEASTGYVDPITGTTTSLPTVLAVGSRFTIDYTSIINGGTGSVQGDSSYTVSPASPRLAVVDGDSLLAKRTGYLALLAYSPSTQSVEDFVFVRFANIASLTPDRAEVSLAADATETLSVTAQDDAMELLAGRLACAWSVTSGSDEVLIDGPNDGAEVRIQAVADGEATVSVVCGGQGTKVLVHVAGGVTVGDGGAEAGDAATDARARDAKADAKEGDAKGDAREGGAKTDAREGGAEGGDGGLKDGSSVTDGGKNG